MKTTKKLGTYTVGLKLKEINTEKRRAKVVDAIMEICADVESGCTARIMLRSFVHDFLLDLVKLNEIAEIFEISKKNIQCSTAGGSVGKAYKYAASATVLKYLGIYEDEQSEQSELNGSMLISVARRDARSIGDFSGFFGLDQNKRKALKLAGCEYKSSLIDARDLIDKI